MFTTIIINYFYSANILRESELSAAKTSGLSFIIVEGSAKVVNNLNGCANTLGRIGAIKKIYDYVDEIILVKRAQEFHFFILMPI